MSQTEFELYMLRLWKSQEYEEVYRYKHRIKLYRGEDLQGIELFYDVTNGQFFDDVQDIASLDDAYAEDHKVSVEELIKKKRGAGMTQERTEQEEVEYWKTEAECNDIRYRQACGKIDRLNAELESMGRWIEDKEHEIRDLTAKVQDRDAEIIRQRERGDRLDSELHKQNCRNQDQVEEIERLRAEAVEREKELSQLRPAYDQMLESLEYAHEALGDAYDASPENSAVQGITFLAYNEVGEALKGAE